MTRPHTSTIVIAAYWAIATFTFGWAAHHNDGICGWHNDKACRGANGFMAATAWPFYWSWVAFDIHGENGK